MKQKYKQDFIKAGALAKEVRAFGKTLIKKGVSYNEVTAKITQKIFDLGARPAFPPQIAMNEVAAHFLVPPGSDHIFNDEVIKLDIGVCFNGAIGDCAVSIDLSGKYQKLIEAVEDALQNAEKIVKVGLPVREIGRVIDETISSYGFLSVKNLCGHGLGFHQIHTPPSIPNYCDQSKAIIRAGMTFAIEPFATNGMGLIYEKGEATIFSLVKMKNIKSESGRIILEKINSFDGLPFAIHELMHTGLTAEAFQTAFKELCDLGIIHGYPPLVEKKNGMVVQAENSILVDESGQVLITTR